MQVWYRQDPTGFRCTYCLDSKVPRNTHSPLASDGLTVAIVPQSPSAKCCSWNLDTAQVRPVDSDNHMYIYGSEYSPDEGLFACRYPDDTHILVWDTRTGRLVSKFPTSEVDAVALSPTLIEHSSGDRLTALWFEGENTTSIYTGHLYA